ncbi:UDP-forming cellulose synthase catalytic subunit [Pusillimonas sp. CC-YST705]|uniref:Cellulose synthase catalytic subunit [UDP-forming] n=1 Tax=Mesopusillimonas faecipullorum TaxID=2755040 RepID=A0ABS8CFF1_9BURK|nr:UDP-forming cellulose synthase catalytic subunit [Mesopusillimonas faecipullorum]MCB5364534.1 UDP-forming cellulose synthase catalytic subunit [Mesopusillimonas faecipullorum]
MNSATSRTWRQRAEAAAQKAAGLSLWRHRFVRIVLLILALIAFGTLIMVPLGFWPQVLFSACMLGLALVLRPSGGRLVSQILIALSVVISLRYMYWRITETLGFTSLLDALFGYGLLLAEIYALLVLLLGYMQTAWPLHRKPVPMPEDVDVWPTVDVYVPTYNEPLSVVRQTLYGALALDWPQDKLRVYLLDDGRRPEFRELCEEIGCGYMTRDDNRHAKAGNLNAALARTDGEYIAIFDCDHIPTRSFLQLSMGWFLRDSKLAMLQTPHHFFSPDPFERNLNTFQSVPNEGNLFYGVVQEGNDLWNASFFCGSCAIMRRSMLEEIGGVAVETVTEDAHTALKLNRKGYNTAYLGIPQAAGLATESLSAHVGQRMRWARGMAQIARLDNPLLGPGLKLGQRLCYLNAMLHFFFGLPRLVFLTAPLAYLFFGAHVFQASALMIAAYALPHIIQSNMTNSRLQGRFRHSFWNEVYESVLAWYILRPVLSTFINPRRGAFNVTAKGGIIEKSFFDANIARPYILLLSLNLLGMAIGLVMLAFNFDDPDQVMTILMNLLWTLFNVVLTGACVAVSLETRQVRHSPRVEAELPAMVRTSEGLAYRCSTYDFSEQGLGITLPPDIDIPVGTKVEITLRRGDDEASVPTHVVLRQGRRMGVKLDDLTPEQTFHYTQMTFARADLWASSWNTKTPDAPLKALHEVLRIGVRGLGLFGAVVVQNARSWMTRTQSGSDKSSTKLKAER